MTSKTFWIELYGERRQLITKPEQRRNSCIGCVGNSDTIVCRVAGDHIDCQGNSIIFEEVCESAPGTKKEFVPLTPEIITRVLDIYVHDDIDSWTSSVIDDKLTTIDKIIERDKLGNLKSDSEYAEFLRLKEKFKSIE